MPGCSEDSRRGNRRRTGESTLAKNTDGPVIALLNPQSVYKSEASSSTGQRRKQLAKRRTSLETASPGGFR